MSLFSFHFLAFLSLLILAYHQSWTARYRKLLLSAANLLFLLTFVPNARDWVAFAVLLACGFGMLCLVRAWSWRYLPGLLIVLSLMSLVLLKRYRFLALVLPASVLDHPLQLIGISYMTFKLIHMIVDLRQLQLAPFGFWSYANYQLGFFSLIAGPIQRYNDFHKFWEGQGSGLGTQTDGLQAWNRVLSGMIKLGLVAAVAMRAYEFGKQGVDDGKLPVETLLSFLLSFYAYPAYVYFNFSGYCDIVIGAARLIGMTHQENFDRPYLARNMLDFWNRWHISLTLWIRDYVFMTSYKWVAERWSRHAAKIGYVLLFMALVLAGVWHGSTWNFVVFGIIHGIGVAATRIYTDVLKNALGRAGVKKYMASPWIRRLSVCATLHYVCFSFLFFTPDLAGTIERLRLVLTKVF